jgi:hypothetical protein
LSYSCFAFRLGDWALTACLFSEAGAKIQIFLDIIVSLFNFLRKKLLVAIYAQIIEVEKKLKYHCHSIGMILSFHWDFTIVPVIPH